MFNSFKYGRVIPFVALLILLTAGFASSATLVFIDPVTSSVSVGSSFSIDVRVSDVTNLYGASIELQFDPIILEATSIVPGNAPEPDFVVQNEYDNNSGVINYAVTSLSPSPPITGDGVIVTIHFKKIASGTSALDFNSILLADSDGLPITVTTQTGSVEDSTTSPTSAFIDPATATVTLGSSFSIDVRVNNVVELYDAQIELKYDASILEATSIVPGNAPEPDFIFHSIDNKSGVIAYAVTQLPPTPPKTGDFVIAKIHFNTIAFGTAALSFKKIILSDSDGSPITLDTQGGIIEVKNKSQGKILWLTLPAILNKVSR